VTVPSLDLLVLTDLHYIHAADDVCTIEERNCALGPALIHRALQDLQTTGVQPDALLLLGDLVNNGLAAGADEDLFEYVQAAHEVDLPLLALPGNHDGDYARFVDLLGCPAGLHHLGGYGFLIFHDHVAPDHATTRPEETLDLPQQIAGQHPGLLLIALQHNPLHPRIEHEYPFMPTNVDQILQSYREANVLLSLSGHYHPGQPAHQVGLTTYCTLPATCEAPFVYAHVRLRGRTVAVSQHALADDE
jgi:hypothetical protein